MWRLNSILATLAALAAVSLHGQAPSLEPGQPFPDLALPALEDGRPLSVADFGGKKLILHVWASW